MGLIAVDLSSTFGRAEARTEDVVALGLLAVLPSEVVIGLEMPMYVASRAGAGPRE